MRHRGQLLSVAAVALALLLPASVLHAKSIHVNPGQAGASDAKPYRFLTPTERPPAGLPEWFSRRDANGDAQVPLAEYTDSLTEKTARDFARYDLNNDGKTTAAECLAAQRQGR